MHVKMPVLDVVFTRRFPQRCLEQLTVSSLLSVLAEVHITFMLFIRRRTMTENGNICGIYCSLKFHWIAIASHLAYSVKTQSTCHYFQLSTQLKESCSCSSALLLFVAKFNINRLVFNISTTAVFIDRWTVSQKLCRLHYVTETSHLYSLRDF